jgi:hypothetical protein
MNTWDLLLQYAKIARPIILEDFRRDSCIASTAITIGVMQYFGIRAVPFPCRAMVFNKAFAERIDRARRLPNETETIEWTSGPDNAWSVGVGFPNTTQQYVGHLAAMVDDKYLVDASIDQANRPAKDMILPPVMLAGVSRDFRRAKKSERHFLRSDDGMVIIYEPRPKDKVWLSSPDWNEKTRHTRSVLRIVAALNNEK